MTPRRAILVGMLVAFASTFACRWLAFTRVQNGDFVHVANAQQLRLGARPVREHAYLDVWRDVDTLSPGYRSNREAEGGRRSWWRPPGGRLAWTARRGGRATFPARLLVAAADWR